MSDKNFLNIHVLTSHSPSCLNRDDMNMQKSAVFGGVRRVRISSQCLKKAMRDSDYFENVFGEKSIRTLKLDYLKEVCRNDDRLTSAFNSEFIDELVDRIAGRSIAAEKKTKQTDDTEPKPEKEVAVAPWCIEEIKRIGEIIQNAQKDGKDDKKIEKLLKPHAESLNKAMSTAVDIALFGRMTTSGLMTHVDAAASVAHVITTHAVDADIDWFTATDDLMKQRGETGSGHLNTQEFSSGVFYRYASVNIRQLQENMGRASRDDALNTSSHLVHLLATVVPSAKQNSFGAYNLADYVLVSLDDLPVSAANAFETPVKADFRNRGFIKPSIEKFEEYIDKVYTGYGLAGSKVVFTLQNSQFEPVHKTLDDLKNWMRSEGR